MVGDKVHDDPRDAGYKRRMRAALGEVGSPTADGVIWHGGQPRAEAMRIAAEGDIGLSWRHPELDASLELSTKVLEFGQLGLPVILNRTPMHEALLGADYPLFAASLDDVADVAALPPPPPAVFRLAASRTSAAAEAFALDRAAERLRVYLAQAVASAPSDWPGALVAVGRGRRRAAAGGDRRARPEVLHPADQVLQAPAGPRGPGRPVGGAGRARRGRVARSWPTGPTSSSASGAARTPSGTAATSAATPGSWSTCTGSSCTRTTRARSRSATSTR